ncbi:MAG: TadE family protein [Actinomycetota bacterium]
MNRGERGSASLEAAIVAPALMLLIVGALQFGLVHHARHVARTAAQEAARAAAAEGATAEDGEARGREVLASGLGRSAGQTSVEVDTEPDLVRARVGATMRGLLPIPGLSSFTLKADATVFAERFRPLEGAP